MDPNTGNTGENQATPLSLDNVSGTTGTAAASGLPIEPTGKPQADSPPAAVDIALTLAQDLQQLEQANSQNAALALEAATIIPETEDPVPELGLAKEVERLLKMPQHLCKQRGICCKVATFKGSLSFKEIQALAADPEAAGHESARDFASIFLPYDSQAHVREIASEFVDRVRDVVEKRGDDPDKISFFHCKYVLEDGRCGVHEDRPVGCRMYPFPHKNTIYHPGCGFEQQGGQNWAQIERILEALGIANQF
jgi:Fe-S-cluster containining protein